MTGRTTSPALSPADIAAFEKLRIPAELLATARTQRVTDREARDDYGIKAPPSRDMAGIIFPYFSPLTGKRVTARLRRDNPEIEDGKPKNKYVSPYGDGRHLYFPPGAALKLQDGDTPIALVEAEKSALALTSWADRVGMNLVTLALGGCWSWRGVIGKAENAKGERVDVLGPLADLSYCDGRKVYVLLDSNAATNPKVGQARAALVAELRTRKCNVLVCDLPIVDGVNGPDDLVGILGDDAMGEVFTAANGELDRPAEFSDDALALRFTNEHGSDLRYTASLGRWNRWDGTHWPEDDTLEVYDLARTSCRATAATTEKSLVARIGSAQTIAAVERLARSDRRHAATVEQWDADVWLLNTPGGVVDLRTASLRPALRSDYMTKLTAAIPGGDCPLWRSFLAQITAEDEELQRFMQRMCGYAATGVTREQAMFFLYGTGANGKSVFMSTVSGVLGDYARSAPIEAFIASSNEHHPTDLAGLCGARLVTAIETEDGRHWAESKLKALTGGDRIAARFMRQDFFEYTPQFKLIISGNHKPGLRTVDTAIRRRFNLIPFEVTIPPAKRDLELAEKLRAEWGGILQWMVDGALIWQRDGLDAPITVTEATESYFAAEDAISQWIVERCELGTDYWESSRRLFADWSQWAEANGEAVGKPKGFSQRIGERNGVSPKPTTAARGFSGIRLKNTTMTDVTHAPVMDVTRTRVREHSKRDDVSHLSSVGKGRVK